MKSFIAGSVFSVIATVLTFSATESPKQTKEYKSIEFKSTIDLLQESPLYTKVEGINKLADSIDVEIKKHKSNNETYR